MAMQNVAQMDIAELANRLEMGLPLSPDRTMTLGSGGHSKKNWKQCLQTEFKFKFNETEIPTRTVENFVPDKSMRKRSSDALK